MLDNFLASWPLFQHAYLSGWLIALLLSLLGVIVVARDQIFLGVAIAQSSTLGIAVAMRLGEVLTRLGVSWGQSQHFFSAMAVLFAVLAAILTAHSGSLRHESHEARTGWLFLSTSSLAILLVTHSPHGLAEVQRLVSSSLIGATALDVWVLTGGVLLTVVGLAAWHRALLLFTLDPTMAMAVGMRIRLWTLSVTLWLGLAIGLSIRVAGVFYVFGCLILPALIARNLCRAVRPMFLVAPLIAVAAGVIGSVLADSYDSPPAQVTVALLCLCLAAAWWLRSWRQRHAREG